MKLSTALLVVITLMAGVAQAEGIVVIVNPKNEAKLNKDLVASYYIGDAKAWTGGVPIRLLDLPMDSAVRATFDKLVLGKSTQQMKDIWMKNAMMGKAEPPKELASDADVKKAVAESRMSMGYIKASSVDDSVRVALEL